MSIKIGLSKPLAFIPLLLLVGAISGMVPCQADTGPWGFMRPDGTQHWYTVVSVPGGITWPGARAKAITAGGYLATLTSQEENDFVYGLCNESTYWNPRAATGGTLIGPWIGGKQQVGAPEPDGQWVWDTGEAFAFTNWAPGQPDDFIHNENSMYFGEITGARINAWSDTLALDTNVQSYIIEYDTSPRTVGLLLQETNVTPGLVLFAPLSSTNTYLINNDGLAVHQWPSAYIPGNAVYLAPTGTLFRTALLSNPIFTRGGQGGRIEKIAWDGTLLWAYDYSDTNVCQHHDIELLPNGHILILAWERFTSAQAIAEGRDPTTLGSGELWAEHLIEVAPTGTYGGTIVWEWHVWDHLIQEYDSGQFNYGVVSNHPERIHLNYMYDTDADWNHGNGIDYNKELDQIIISSRQFSEAWVIDHSTTTAEAAGSSGGTCGKGGDLLYRWGNPFAWQGGSAASQQLFVQHNVQWIPTNRPGGGHFLAFNNGTGRSGGNYTSIDEWIPPLDATTGCYTQQVDGSWGPTGAIWTYVAPTATTFYASFISGAQRTTNGNTLICDGPGGHFFEVTDSGETVWSYECPINSGSITQGVDAVGNTTFRSERYPLDENYFTGLTIPIGTPLEIYPPDTDYDGDTMEDAWECLYALNPTLATDAGLDPDADSVSNLDEYIADTDPHDSNDFFAVTSISGTTNILVFFETSTNRSYTFEKCADSLTNGWSPVTGQALPVGSGGTDHFTDTNAPASASYRIRVHNE